MVKIMSGVHVADGGIGQRGVEGWEVCSRWETGGDGHARFERKRYARRAKRETERG